MTLDDLQALFSQQLTLTQEEISRLDRVALVENMHGDPKLPRRQRNIQSMQNNLLLRMGEWNELDQDTLLERWWNVGCRAMEDSSTDMDKVEFLGIERVLSFRS